MADLTVLAHSNAERWNSAKIVKWHDIFDTIAKRLIAGKPRYQKIAQQTGVPWGVIAVIHQRESNQNFSTNLANGEPWNRQTRLVPKGRGPFKSFEAAAVDALVNCQPYAAKWQDWSIGGTLCLLEQYNGLGYANGPRDIKGNKYPPQPSPYIWSGTNIYVVGKYTADGVYDPTAVDKQLGCAGLLMAMQGLDNSILASPTRKSFWQRLWDFLNRLGEKK